MNQSVAYADKLIVDLIRSFGALGDAGSKLEVLRRSVAVVGRFLYSYDVDPELRQDFEISVFRKFKEIESEDDIDEVHSSMLRNLRRIHENLNTRKTKENANPA